MPFSPPLPFSPQRLGCGSAEGTGHPFFNPRRLSWFRCVVGRLAVPDGPDGSEIGGLPPIPLCSTFSPLFLSFRQECLLTSVFSVTTLTTV